MTTVLMKLLETRPADYDRGIRLLTLGRAEQVKERVAEFVQPGDRILEIGCGTGALALRCARQGAKVVAIDASTAMLEEARARVESARLSQHIELHHMDATTVAEHLAPASFDWVVSTLVFSELGSDTQRYVLEACGRLLKPEGRLLVADEVLPADLLPRLLFFLVRIPLVILTWLITRTTTTVLRGFPRQLALAGYRGRQVETWLGGSLTLFLAWPAEEPREISAPEVPRLRHRVTPWTLLKDLYGLLWRNIPPYPKVRVGLYRIGAPGRSSPVLVTGNYDLTVRRLLRAVNGQIDAWLLVADSAGINVWCGAGGGHFTAATIVAVVNVSRIEDLVDHRRLILPQLCANGVHGATIEEETGWSVYWGPCYADDITAYLGRGRRKTDEMRRVRFPLLDRLEMAVVMWGIWALVFGIVLTLVRRSLLLPTLLILLAQFLLIGVTWPWWPTEDGFWQGIGLALISAGLLVGWSALFAHLPPRTVFNRAIGVGMLGLFVGADFQGGNPGMRGGEVVHLWKLVPVGLLLLAAYLLVPHVVGW